MKKYIKTIENDFFKWIKPAPKKSSMRELKKAYQSVSNELQRKRVLSQPLGAVTKPEEIKTVIQNEDKIFTSKRSLSKAAPILKAYLQFLEERAGSDNHNTNGLARIEPAENWIRYDFNNEKDFEKTYPVYCVIDDTKIEGEKWARIFVNIVEREIGRNNPKLKTLYENSLSETRAERPFFMKEKIKGLNCSKLSNGYWVNVNYNIPRQLERIKTFCFYCGYDKSEIVLYGAPKDEAMAISGQESDRKVSRQEISINMAEDFLRSKGLTGGTVQDVINEVQPGASVSSTKQLLDNCKNLIAMPKNIYIHVDAFIDLDEAELVIKKILKTHFIQFGGYSNNKLLFGAASHDLSMFLNDNDCEDIDSVYSIARYFFEKRENSDKYVFSYPHIFEKEPDFPPTLKGLMINLARMNSGILDADEAKNYLQKTMLTYGGLNQLLQTSSTSTFLMYNSDKYILSEKLNIDEKWERIMHDKLDALFNQENIAYVIPRDINTTWLATLPALPQGLEWTILLLQEVLKKFPNVGFRPITPQADQSIDTIAAAIVPCDSQIETFPDVVALYMYEHHELPLRLSCEELRTELRDAGMLEGYELVYALPKTLNDYRFSWSDENKTVLVRGH